MEFAVACEWESCGRTVYAQGKVSGTLSLRCLLDTRGGAERAVGCASVEVRKKREAHTGVTGLEMALKAVGLDAARGSLEITQVA